MEKNLCVQKTFGFSAGEREGGNYIKTINFTFPPKWRQ